MRSKARSKSDITTASLAEILESTVVEKIVAILNDPERAYKNEGAELHRSLTLGANISQGNLEPINRDKIFESYKQVAINTNNVEMLRTGNAHLPPQHFIISAHERKKKVI